MTGSLAIDADVPLPARKSLRARGLVATLALLAYLFGAGLYIATERAHIYDNMQALERVSRHEKALALTEAAVNGALVDVNEASNAALPDPPPPSELRLYMESCTRLLLALDEFDPSYALLQRAIARSYNALQAAPVRANWIDLRESLRRTADELEIRHRRLAGERDSHIAGYQRHYDAVTVESLLLATIGLVAFGSLAAWFFARLAHDIRHLEEHARHIVHGARGVVMAVRREDELGRLIHAVNRMSVDLDEREKEIQLDAHRRSHQDKMLAVGALAAGVAHEVNNPLAVISGAAQELQAAQGRLPPEHVLESAQLILSQALRAGQVARQLAEVAAPQPAELDWIDLNALVRHVVQLMGYDRRYRRHACAVDGDATLPAVRSSGNAIQQVLMQMLSLVYDAVAARPEALSPVRISTSCDGAGVAVQMLFPPALDFTRGEVQRSLLLSRATVEPLRGRLAFGQVEGPLQSIKLTLPVDPGSDPG